LTDIDIRWVGNSDIQLKDGRLSTPIPWVPERFGGLWVELVNDQFSFSANDAEPSGPNESAFDEAGSMESAKIKIEAGNKIFIRGPEYGREPPRNVPHQAIRYLEHVFRGSSARVGLDCLFAIGPAMSDLQQSAICPYVTVTMFAVAKAF
jgi:hypothetical protein